jgi:hypothetical protein
MNIDDVTSKLSDAASAGVAPIDAVQGGLEGAEEKITQVTDKVSQFAEEGPGVITQGVSDFVEKQEGLLNTITGFFKK